MGLLSLGLLLFILSAFSLYSIRFKRFLIVARVYAFIRYFIAIVLVILFISIIMASFTFGSKILESLKLENTV